MNLREEVQSEFKSIINDEENLSEPVYLLDDNSNEYKFNVVIYLTSWVSQNGKIQEYDEITGKIFISKENLNKINIDNGLNLKVKKDLYFKWNDQTCVIQKVDFQWDLFYEATFVVEEEPNNIMRDERRGRGY